MVKASSKVDRKISHRDWGGGEAPAHCGCARPCPRSVDSEIAVAEAGNFAGTLCAGGPPGGARGAIALTRWRGRGASAKEKDEQQPHATDARCGKPQDPIQVEEPRNSKAWIITPPPARTKAVVRAAGVRRPSARRRPKSSRPGWLGGSSRAAMSSGEREAARSMLPDASSLREPGLSDAARARVREPHPARGVVPRRLVHEGLVELSSNYSE